MIRLTRLQDVTVIELGPSYASLDDDTLEEIGGVLLTKAATADPPKVVVDLSETNYIGSGFIELLVRAWKRLRQRQGTMALCGLRPFCAEVLHTSRLDTLWGDFSTQDQAVAAIAGHSDDD